MIKKAAIISIGDELLLGQILDTNSTWLSAQLTALGIEVTSRRVCSDRESDILEALRGLSSENDLVITTGGLGPTKDDKTVQALCTYFGVDDKRDAASVDRIKTRLDKYLKGRINEQLLELNLKQADIPSNATALDNPQGAAPGIWVEEGDTYYLSLPGVPLEVKAIVSVSALPILEEESSKLIRTYNIIVSGIPESALSIQLQDFESQLDPNTSLAYLPRLSHIVLRLTQRGEEQSFEASCRSLREAVGDYLLAEGDSILQELMHLLQSKNLKITTAESCTGGGLASLICDVPGASNIFDESLVSYANEVKMKKLGVSAETLATDGAVSEATVLAMAQGQLHNTSSDIAVSISGILGPGGGSAEKPIGLTYIGISTAEGTEAYKLNGRWDRENNKKYVLDSAIILLIKRLQKY